MDNSALAILHAMIVCTYSYMLKAFVCNSARLFGMFCLKHCYKAVIVRFNLWLV